MVYYGLKKNESQIFKIFGKPRKPDFINGDIIREVKAVKRLDNTEQLRETAALIGARWEDPEREIFNDFVRTQTGGIEYKGDHAWFSRYIIHVKPETEIGGTLQSFCKKITDVDGKVLHENPNGVYEIVKDVILEGFDLE